LINLDVLPKEVWAEENLYPEFDETDFDVFDTLETEPNILADETFQIDLWACFANLYEDGLLFLLKQSCALSGRLSGPAI